MCVYFIVTISSLFLFLVKSLRLRRFPSKMLRFIWSHFCFLSFSFQQFYTCVKKIVEAFKWINSSSLIFVYRNEDEGFARCVLRKCHVVIQVWKGAKRKTKFNASNHFPDISFTSNIIFNSFCFSKISIDSCSRLWDNLVIIFNILYISQMTVA